MPSSRAFAFDDPYPYQASIRAAQVEITPTTRGHFRAELWQIDLHRLWMQGSRESLPLICRGSIDADRAAIDFPVGASGFRVNGLDVSPGEIVVHSWKSGHTLSLAPAHGGSMSLTPADLAATSRALTGRELTVPSVAHIVRPLPAHMTRLLSLHEQAAQLARTAPDILARPAVAHALEQALVRAMITCLIENTSVEVGVAHQRHAVIIARLEEFLEANAGEPIHLADICAATGGSESTLRICCQERLGMGPVHYLRLRRMHLARRALVRASPETATVTGIATEYGFWELGRFSVEYRKLFAEPPSATLRRAPTDLSALRGDPFAFATAESA
jgi:AraC-like DNA-binding protein